MGIGWGCWAAAVLTAGAAWAAVDTASLPEPAYNETFSLSAEIALPEGVSEGDLLTLTGGGGTASAKDVRKGFRVTLAGSSLTVSAAGKGGSSSAVVTQAVAVPGTVRVALAVANTGSGTGVTVRAAVTGGSAGSKANYNFDNVAHSQGTWGANAPFDTWSVSSSVTALQVVTGTAWTAAELETRVAETVPEVTFSGKTATSVTASYPLAFEGLEQQAYGSESWEALGFMTAGGGAATNAALFTPDVNVQTAGRWRAVFALERTLTFESVTLQVPLYNSTGAVQEAGAERDVRFLLYAGGAQVADSGVCTLSGASTPAASAAANAVTLAAAAPVALAAGETLTLVCERADETVGCYFGLQSLAFGLYEPEKAAAGTAELTVPEGTTVNWTDAAWLLADGSVGTLPENAVPTVLWQGGELVVPAGVTVTRLASAADSAGGTLTVRGRIAGADSGEPGVAAVALPTTAEVRLEDGAELRLDGRLWAPVRAVSGSVSLGAATAEGVLTLDALTLEAGAEAYGVAGCIEIYRRSGFPAADGVTVKRWDCPGYRLRLE